MAMAKPFMNPFFGPVLKGEHGVVLYKQGRDHKAEDGLALIELARALPPDEWERVEFLPIEPQAQLMFKVGELLPAFASFRSAAPDATFPLTVSHRVTPFASWFVPPSAGKALASGARGEAQRAPARRNHRLCHYCRGTPRFAPGAHRVTPCYAPDWLPFVLRRATTNAASLDPLAPPGAQARLHHRASPSQPPAFRAPAPQHPD